MKTKHIFWGLLFISLGLLILLYNLNAIYFDLSNIWRYWPIVIILWGVSYFTKNVILKGFIAGAAAIVLAVTLFAAFNSSFYFFNDAFSIHDSDFNLTFDGNSDTSNYTESFTPDIKNAKFELKAGAGAFLIRDSTDDLISAVAQGYKNNYEMTRNDSDSNTVVKMKMLKRSFTFGDGHNKNKLILRFNTAPVWDLNFDIGAASSDFDLSSFKIDNVNINTGAASLKLKLGDKVDVSKVRVKAGASSIEIEVPDSAGCEIRTSTALSSRNFDGFDKIDSNLYRTDNFDSAKKKIYLRIDTGISSIHVSRYESSWE